MASIDPRKKESITNQANYVLTTVTTIGTGALISAVQSGVVSLDLFWVLSVFWIMGFTAKQVELLVKWYIGKPIRKSGVVKDESETPEWD